MKRKILSGILALAMVLGMAPTVPQTAEAAEPALKEIVLEKSTQGNPVAGFDENGELRYAGDPAIMVDGDTVYLYVGHDNARAGASYTMPNYLCYSTTDLKEWKYEGVTMEMSDVSWSDNNSAWASQVIRYQDKYYLLYCAEKPGTGKCVGAAVSDSPTGPYKLLGSYLLNFNEDANHGFDSEGGHVRDMNLFKDDDGTAYVMYSSDGNQTMHIARLNDEYTNVAKPQGEAVEGVDFTRNFINISREAPAMFKYNNKYYMIIVFYII